MPTKTTWAPAPACCVGKMDSCGYFPHLSVAACGHADCAAGYYAPCARHLAMDPAARRADYERMHAPGPRKGA
jgi:hypothetical protein